MQKEEVRRVFMDEVIIINISGSQFNLNSMRAGTIS